MADCGKTAGFNSGCQVSRFDSTGTFHFYVTHGGEGHSLKGRGGPSAHPSCVRSASSFCELFFVMAPLLGLMTTLSSGTTALSIVALVTILIDTMKFTTSVVAVALAAAAPSVSGTSSAGISLRIYNRYANICVRSAISEFVTNKSSKHGTSVV